MAATQAATLKSESAKMFVPLAAEPVLVVVWTRKVVFVDHSVWWEGRPNSSEKTPSRTCGEVVNLRQNSTNDCWLDWVSSSVL